MITAIVTRQSEADTRKRLRRIYQKTARQSTRRSIRQVGARTAKSAKTRAPRGRTNGQFARSITHRERSYQSGNFHITMVGQNRRRVSTPRQIARAAARTGRLSQGLSGRGFQPQIHWIEAGTDPHRIRPVSARRLYWNIAKGNTRIPTRDAPTVQHPGHRGTQFLSKTERSMRDSNATFVIKNVENDIVRDARASL
ncbi:MAG: hypothetical protein AAGJ83_08745 [Planctomycetota bacterium]